MPYSLVIFDLDGTLADSVPWFQRNVNDVADRFGFRRVEDEDVESLRHAGSREILKRLRVPLWKLPAIARHMRRVKAKHLDDIPLFPGIHSGDAGGQEQKVNSRRLEARRAAWRLYRTFSTSFVRRANHF